ncbi:MAG: HEAT repeat domain-containing protein [Spirochaetia bacterium]|nr:HEAT repeat domain-containing protein [Spirochaetia bacterium]
MSKKFLIKWIFYIFLYHTQVFSLEINLQKDLTNSISNEDYKEIENILLKEQYSAEYWSKLYELLLKKNKSSIMELVGTIITEKIQDPLYKKQVITLYSGLVEGSLNKIVRHTHHNRNDLYNISILLKLSGILKSPDLLYPVSQFIAYQLIDIRRECYVALSKINDDRITPVLVELSQSQNPVERMYAIDALYYLKDKRAMELLIEILERDENKSVRYYAIRTLENMGAIEAVPSLIQIIKNDKSDDVRLKAIYALQNLQTPAGLAVINDTLGDKNKIIRKGLLETIGVFNNKVSASYISNQLAQEDDDDLKMKEIELLFKFESTASMSGLNRIIKEEKNENILLWAIYTVSYLKDERGIDAISGRLLNSSESIQIEAAIALGILRAKKHVGVLSSFLINENNSYNLRSSALFALEKIDDDSIIPVLFETAEKCQDLFLGAQIKTLLKTMLNRRYKK